MRKRSVVFLLVSILGSLSPAARAKDADAPPEKVSVSLKTLKQNEQQVEELVKRVLPCTVCVRSANGPGSGSGVVVSEDGLVMTAAHVTRAAGNDLVVVFPNGREVKAKPLGADRTRDAALVQILEKGEYPHAELGHSDGLKTNQWCVALGHAGGFDPRRTPPVRLGRVLNNGRFLTTDCTLISGDSGGPLFDLSGNVIGIHSNIGEALWQNNHVPAQAFHAGWDRMLAGESWGRQPGGRADPNRPVLGVQLDPTPHPDGCAIREVAPGSPAERAGVKDNDVIQEIEGKGVRSPADVVGRLSSRKAGDEVSLKVLHDGESREVKVKLVRASELANPNAAPGRRPEGPGKRSQPQGPTKKSDDSKTKDDAAANQKRKKSSSDDPKKNDPPKPGVGKPESTADNADSASKPDKPSGNADGGQKNPNGDPPLDLQQLMRRARRSGGRLKLTPEQMKQLRKQMGNRMRIGPGQRPSAMADDEWVKQVFAAYQPVVATARKSALPVFVDDKQVALATAISSDGRLVTKASLIEGKSFEVELPEKQRVAGVVTKTLKDFDVAVIKIECPSLVPINLGKSDGPIQLGEFVASVGRRKEPEGIGVVSVLARNLDASNQGFLGVRMESSPDGIRIGDVQPGSPADKAGLEKGDILTVFDGKKPKSVSQFAKTISRHAPGEKVEVKVKRDEKQLTMMVELGDRSSVTLMPGSSPMMRLLGGKLSKRRTGFKSAVQHDCPIDPEDCGGPLVDLNGHLVGINIARAGRIKSYAIPAEVIRGL